MIRDPKDVFVSSYFFLRDGIYGPAMWSVDTWYQAYVSGVNFMGLSWPEATASYWRQRHRPNVLLLSFKTMKRDLEGTVRRIAAFLDIRRVRGGHPGRRAPVHVRIHARHRPQVLQWAA